MLQSDTRQFSTAEETASRQVRAAAAKAQISPEKGHIYLSKPQQYFCWTIPESVEYINVYEYPNVALISATKHATAGPNLCDIDGTPLTA